MKLRTATFVLISSISIASSANAQNFAGAPIDFGVTTKETTNTTTFTFGNTTQTQTSNGQISPSGTPVALSGTEYVNAQCGPNGFVGQYVGTCGTANPLDTGSFALPLSDFARASTVSDVSAALATLQNDVTVLSGRVDAVEKFASDSRREARQGIASSVALASASMPSAPGKTSWVVNTAEFKGEAAFGASLAHRFTTNFPLAVTAGWGISGSNTVARAGLAGEF